MRRFIVVPIAVVSILALAAPAMASSGPSAGVYHSATPTRHVIALEPCYGTGHGNYTWCWQDLEPHLTIDYPPEPEYVFLRHARWSHWNKYSARARATYIDRPGHGIAQTRVQVTVRLHRPRYLSRVSNEYEVFTRMRITGPNHSASFRWSWAFQEWVGRLGRVS